MNNPNLKEIYIYFNLGEGDERKEKNGEMGWGMGLE